MQLQLGRTVDALVHHLREMCKDLGLTLKDERRTRTEYTAKLCLQGTDFRTTPPHLWAIASISVRLTAPGRGFLQLAPNLHQQPGAIAEAYALLRERLMALVERLGLR